MAEEKKVILLKEFKLPKTPGHYVRMLFLSGEQKGESYFLVGDRVIIGRGDSCDIPVKDPVASKEHAELKKVGDNYYLSDLGSQNGIIVNDLKIGQQVLRDGDRVIIGKTVLKYGHIDILENIPAIIDVTNEEKNKKVGLLSNFTLSDSKPEIKKDDSNKGLSKKKKIIYAIAIVMVGLLFLTEDPDANKKKMSNRTNAGKDLIDDKVRYLMEKKQIEQDKEVEKKLNSLFQSGLREEREGNYYRAINEFNMALIISPGNARADFYLKRTKDRLKKEVERTLIRALQNKDALRYKKAASEYCAVMRLLQYDPEDENYKKSEENVREIEKILGMDERAIKCL